MENPYILMCISDINKRKETLQEKDKKWKQKLQDEKMNILDQLIMKRDIHDNQKKLEKMNTLSQKIMQFDEQSHSFGKENIIFVNLKKEIEHLGAYLTPAEQEELTKIATKEILALRVEEQKKVNALIEDIKSLLNSLNLSNVDFKIEDSSLFVRYNHFMNEVKRTTLEKISQESIYFDLKTPQDKVLDNHFVDELELLLNSGKIEMTPSNKKLKDNMKQIKISFAEKEKMANAITAMDNVLAVISNDLKDIDMLRLVKYLETLKQRYLKDFQQLNTYLNGFHLNDFEQPVKEQMKLRELQNNQKAAFLEYTNLSYNLEKIMTEEPNNYEKKKEIEAQMRALTGMVSLKNDVLLEAKRKGKEKYYTEKEEQQALKEAMNEKIENKRNYEAEIEQILRKEAIQELEDEDFEETYEFRNGDAYLANLDKEAIIKQKMEEIRKFAEMTPEERGIYQLKQKGKIAKDATLESLTVQQLSDMRYAYRDSSYDYITKYKQLKQDSNNEEKQDTIHKEYLRYRALNKDKENYLTFREFVNQKQNLSMPSRLEPTNEVEEKKGGPKF